MENLKKTYLLPVRIIDYKGDFQNIDSLLISDIDQPSFYFKNNLTLSSGGFVVLDYGKEICGGVRIVNQGTGNQNDDNVFRIRFGESVSEVNSELKVNNCTNNHSPRDFNQIIPDYSKIEVGNTGFRFIRIDFPNDKNQRLYSINAISYELDLPNLAYFKSDDSLLNKIFKIAQRTATICAQEYIYDGIKRDRLVWVGDLLQEIKTINYTYGPTEVFKKTLAFAEETNPMPGYMQNMPTYNLWYLACLNEYLKLNGSDDFYG